MAEEKSLQGSYDSVSELLSGLMDAFKTGARGTADAFQEDVDALKGGRLPPQAMKAGEQTLAGFNNPMMGTAIPWVPRYFAKSPENLAGINDWIARAEKANIDKSKIQEVVDLRDKILGGEALQRGGWVNPINALLESMGPTGQKASKVVGGIRDVTQKTGAESPGREQTDALENFWTSLKDFFAK